MFECHFPTQPARRVQSWKRPLVDSRGALLWESKLRDSLGYISEGPARDVDLGTNSPSAHPWRNPLLLVLLVLRKWEDSSVLMSLQPRTYKTTTIPRAEERLASYPILPLQLLVVPWVSKQATFFTLRLRAYIIIYSFYRLSSATFKCNDWAP